MIVFFHKKTGVIYAVIHGRIHTDKELAISPEIPGVDPSLIGRHIIGTEQVKVNRDIPILSKGRVVGIRRTEIVKESPHAGPFAALARKQELGEENITHYQFVKSGNTVTMKKRVMHFEKIDRKTEKNRLDIWKGKATPPVPANIP